MTFKEEIRRELESILNYWMTFTPDKEGGGFFGRIDNDNCIDRAAPKGSVLNARILWSFSAAYNFLADDRYLQLAHRAFDYMVKYFVDDKHGGVYWTVDAAGNPLETKKQVYAQAFTLYAFSEYYKASGSIAARERAVELYLLLQQHSYDPAFGGYFEAFSCNWGEMNDLRLSDKDANEKKTMNTHLHVLEAYANLFSIWPDVNLGKHIRELLEIFSSKIINPQNYHLHLFFDEEWNVKGDTISFGHDIEASWLMLEAAEVLQDNSLIERFRLTALRMADAAASALDDDGGLWYEYEPQHKKLLKEKHWWPQSEAIVGFISAWQISGDAKYYKYAASNWKFILNYIVDRQKGEWFWGIKEDRSVMQEDKVGVWKCPYHNSRGCLELLRRLP